MGTAASDRGYARLAAIVLAAASAAAIASLPGSMTGPLRVCADPLRAPVSSMDEQGMANRVAALVASELGTEVRYRWSRRAHRALVAQECDVVAGAVEPPDDAAATPAYFRAGYVITHRPDRLGDVRSLGDPRAAGWRIGVALDRAPLARAALGRALDARGLTGAAVGFAPLGTTIVAQRMVAALAEGTLDVALLWEPDARAYAQSQDFELAFVPAFTDEAEPVERAVAMAVRRGDVTLRAALVRALARAAPEIDAMARDYMLADPAWPATRVAHAQ